MRPTGIANRRWLVWPLAHKRALALSLVVLAGLALAAIVILLTRDQPMPVAYDWRSDWAVERGFNIKVDAQGFRFPTSIAFVPDPGDSPKAPLYFVTELPGSVKVVTNDRSVFTFAEDFFTLRPRRVVPVIKQEVGMAGICLAPEQGQVFVTFSYHDADNILRNNIVRFQSIPATFSLSPTSMIDFTGIFDSHPSMQSHQIGPCQVKDGLLYVSVADAGQAGQSQLLDSLLGKVLRMDLDGNPVPENPFYRNAGIEDARSYVWASGLRNPFGLKLVGERVFVADNGPDVDRFLQITKGGNYLWDGTNVSMGTNADAAFYPGRGVAHIDHYPPNSDLFPDRFKDNFFITMTGNPVRRREGVPAIWAVPYDHSRGKLSSVPRPVLRFQGRENQVVAALGFGPDGLYFAPLLPDKSGFNDVYKITYQPLAEYPHVLEEQLNPPVLMNTFGCFACHSLNENREGTIGPNLDQDDLVDRLEERLNSSSYAEALRKVDELEMEPFISYRDARHEVEQAQGSEKIRAWLYYRLREPRFDDPGAGMPQLNLSSRQARAIADFLSGTSTATNEVAENQRPSSTVTDLANRLSDLVQNQLPIPNRANAKKFLAAFFALGFGVGAVAAGTVMWFFVLRPTRRKDQTP